MTTLIAYVSEGLIQKYLFLIEINNSNLVESELKRSI